jgi:hypothetical protein
MTKVITVKVTNKVEKYTMVRVFSTYELARECVDIFTAGLSAYERDNFNQHWNIETQGTMLDIMDFKG